jgi:glycosyltransferase involved in cell wall biosynthesis
MKRKILIFTPYFTPGFKGGGPIKSIANLIKNLNAEFDFYVITSNKDLGDKEPYKSIIDSEWVKLGKCQVFYIPENFGNTQLVILIRKLSPDIIYLNSFFSFKFSIKIVFMKKFFLLKKSQIILAPRGEFSPGALEIKQFKKAFFLNICKKINSYKSVYWHATSPSELFDILNVINFTKGKIFQAPNFIDSYDGKESTSNINRAEIFHQTNNPLKVCFVSRISRKKNLEFAIKIINKVQRPIVFDIYGPIEDINYWNECNSLINKKSKNEKNIKYCGLLSAKDVVNTISHYDLFFLPTMGENFGHVIVESWAAGVPVLISNLTPWQNLSQKRIGWDVPLDNPALFEKLLMEYDVKDQKKKDKIKRSCIAYISSNQINQEAFHGTKNMFDTLINESE